MRQRPHVRRVLPLALLLGLLAAPRPARAGDDDPPNVKKTFAHVLPDKADRAWTSIPWHATLWDAVIAAHEEKKPILLWAMNGHALACT